MARQRERESWSPWEILGIAGVAIAGLAIVVFAVYAAATDLVGEPLIDTVGIARPAPVWLAWLAIVVGILGGLQLLVTNVRALYRIAQGTQPVRRFPRKRK